MKPMTTEEFEELETDLDDCEPADPALVKAHISLSIAMAITQHQPEAVCVVPCHTEEVFEIMQEAVETMAIELDFADRLRVIRAH
jgi:hypothetical protein